MRWTAVRCWSACCASCPTSSARCSSAATCSMPRWPRPPPRWISPKAPSSPRRAEGSISCGSYFTTKRREVAVSIHADDEFSLRIALESELDDVLPREGLAGLVIARHRKIRRRRVAGAVGLVVVCAGIGVPLGLSGPSSKPPQHNPGQRPDQHTGSVTLIPPARAGAALVIERPAAVLTAAAA